MHPQDQPLDAMVDRVVRHSALSSASQAVLRAMPHKLATVDGGTYLIRDGDKAESCHVLMSGFAYRSRTTGDGKRQILALHTPGEMVDLQNSMLRIADHNMQTLTRSEVAFVPLQTIVEVTSKYPDIARALWTQTLIEVSIAYGWMVNLGCRNARQRVSHLICELAYREKRSAPADGTDVAWPLTQEQIADILGLTAVHVNRTIQALRRDRIISLGKHVLTINDWSTLSHEGDFRSAYLHQLVE